MGGSGQDGGGGGGRRRAGKPEPAASNVIENQKLLGIVQHKFSTGQKQQ